VVTRVSDIFRMGAFAAALLAVTPATAVPACKAVSGRQTVALVELYTSEGCDSCPPADRWLSSTFAPGKTEVGAVALAFHVDYWDRLGWKDRFAAPQWTKRQYDSAHASGTDLVYTPQVLLQGKELRDWHDVKRSTSAIAAVARSPARADIALEITPRAGGVVVNATARVPAAADRGGTALVVALTENGLVSDIRAGENAGKHLEHDHVVRAVRGELAMGAAGDTAGTIEFPLLAGAERRSTIVAFVQNVSTGDVLQALALPITSACSPIR
jgi:hypothetical protein